MKKKLLFCHSLNHFSHDSLIWGEIDGGCFDQGFVPEGFCPAIFWSGGGPEGFWTGVLTRGFCPGDFYQKILTGGIVHAQPFVLSHSWLIIDKSLRAGIYLNLNTLTSCLLYFHIWFILDKTIFVSNRFVSNQG